MAEERSNRSTGLRRPRRDDGGRRRDDDAEQRGDREDTPTAQRDGSDGPRRRSGNRASIARSARELLEELTGHEADSISAMTRLDGGWQLRVEMTELERVPPTTNVMGSYEVELDDDGELVGYELVRRYHRGQLGGDES